ncbi:hypothetical protein SEA_LENNON_55 [Gordonia phage Lennon]|uniref:Uncharacterized protein n=7 Tax=Vividuovirus TaxID=2560251 RepID=A0A2U9PFM1_9CAUD|nr:hypothetical protein BJD57_gp59 [Gordonia phage Vivi2]YP_009615805.1 hypothetical protein FDI74_gp55 [Gordonia phage Lennon]YP_009623006.1 hypothetical protein FDJ33_gp57 [Gordonia phage Brandonk123]YP_010096847.1 hypothetical protein KNT97_gp55 [Gordonia phage Rofo]YP_010099635.1 hypothetical protein KNU23_gp56 [Gordonia phage Tangent]YP_010104465.1 hypothetical protein KNU76_gp53 [Gordonia phage Jabberwocky]AWT50554.1 hypothetical protein PBI_SITAR_55 [Gordonia phage Sitar]QDH92696.1 hy
MTKNRAGNMADKYAVIYPWTLDHPDVLDLTLRARIAYVELIAIAGADGIITDRRLERTMRKDHRERLIAAGLIVENDDPHEVGTYRVLQPESAYAPLVAAG